MLMTALSACIGLLPAAVSTGIGSQVQRPLATVVVGGMFIGPIILLVVVPAVLTLFLGERDQRLPASLALANRLSEDDGNEPLFDDQFLSGRRAVRGFAEHGERRGGCRCRNGARSEAPRLKRDCRKKCADAVPSPLRQPAEMRLKVRPATGRRRK